MTTRAKVAISGRNPDVLTCIANLSNDEVFTPPEFANKMLNAVANAWAEANNGEDIWTSPHVTFLDPFTKSGVFLREITRRLTTGLESEFPDREARVDHILTKQVFGIGITELTSLIARRSVYCSKWADGEHSIASSFDNPDGNIWFKRLEHTWEGGTEWVYTADENGNQVTKLTNGRCKYCGASQATLDRGEGLETHAYALLHTDDVRARIAELFGDDMQFDVVIGNPPYQLEVDAAGQNVMPIYNKFVAQAKKLEPRFLSMVIPSRWMAGGKWLDEFRAEMLNDRRLSVLVDYPNAAEVFPSVGINGGICYFLWDAQHNDDCNASLVRNGQVFGPKRRKLNEFDVFIRDSHAVDILKKVQRHREASFADLVSARDPFGPALSSNFTGYRLEAKQGDIRLYLNLGTKRQMAWVSPDVVTKNAHLVDTWKVLIPKAGSGREREKTGVDLVLSPPLIAAPQSACTLTYVVAGPLGSKQQAQSVDSYLRTRFARFLVSLRKISQDAPRGVYTYVPQQEWDRIWIDDDLYEKYGITEEEQAFIESMIRPMEVPTKAVE